jgi:hypothetical protein
MWQKIKLGANIRLHGDEGGLGSIGTIEEGIVSELDKLNNYDQLLLFVGNPQTANGRETGWLR